MHWHSRIPSILGSSTVFRDFPPVSLMICCEYPLLVFEVLRRVAGDDHQEAGALHLFAYLLEDFFFFFIAGGDVAATMAALKPISS